MYVSAKSKWLFKRLIPDIRTLLASDCTLEKFPAVLWHTKDERAQSRHG